jgi:hypothetical protein
MLTVATSFSSTAAMISSKLTASGFLFNLHQQQHAGNDLLSFPSSTADGFLFINSSRRHRSSSPTAVRPSSSTTPLHHKLILPSKCKTAVVDFAP